MVRRGTSFPYECIRPRVGKLKPNCWSTTLGVGSARSWDFSESSRDDRLSKVSSTSGSAETPGGRRHFTFCRIPSSCDEINKTNLKFSVFNQLDLQTPSSARVSDSTYEGLKLCRPDPCPADGHQVRTLPMRD